MTAMNSKPKFALRMLARREGSTWELLPKKKGLAVILGSVPEPGWANQGVEIAFSYVLADSMSRRLSHVTTSVWQFDSHGMVNDQHAMAEIRRKLDEPPTHWSKGSAPQICSSDLGAICALLKVRLPD